MATPNLVFENYRQDNYYNGLPDVVRGQYDALRYGIGQLSEHEYTQLYKFSTEEYQKSADATVRAINIASGKRATNG